MKKKMLIIICTIGVLLEIYLVIDGYLNEYPIAVNVLLLLGFSGLLYLICGKDNDLVKKDSESPEVKKKERK